MEGGVGDILLSCLGIHCTCIEEERRGRSRGHGAISHPTSTRPLSQMTLFFPRSAVSLWYGCERLNLTDVLNSSLVRQSVSGSLIFGGGESVLRHGYVSGCA